MLLKIPAYLLMVLNFPLFMGLELISYRSLVTNDRFDSTLIKKELVDFISLFQVSASCIKLSWCDAFCLLPNKTAILTDLVISGGFEDTKSGQKVVCYTKRPKVIYPSPQATISSSRNRATAPLRIVENFQDGIYGFDNDQCFSAYTAKRLKWIVVNFSEPKVVSRVVIRTGMTVDLIRNFQQLELRGGNSAPFGNDMSLQLTLLGTFFGPILASQQNTDLIINVSPKTTVQYISLQEADPATRMDICHLEVF